jgi:hypothetical protein
VSAKQNKARGTRGELKVRDALRKRGIQCKRTGLITVEEGEKRPDLEISTVPGGWMSGRRETGEVKTRESFPRWLEEAMDQACGGPVFLNEVGGFQEDVKVLLDLDTYVAMFKALHWGSDEP